MPYGDEWDNGYEVAGYTIVQDPATGVWTYATIDGNGQLSPTALVAGEDQPADLPQHLRNSDSVSPNRYAVAPTSARAVPLRPLPPRNRRF